MAHAIPPPIESTAQRVNSLSLWTIAVARVPFPYHKQIEMGRSLTVFAQGFFWI